MRRMSGLMAGWGLCLLAVATVVTGAEEVTEKLVEQAHKDPDYAVQGEFAGKVDKDAEIGVQVIANGKGTFDAVLWSGGLPGAGYDGKLRQVVPGETKGDAAHFNEGKLHGVLKGDELKLEGAHNGVLKRVVRKSPTLGAKPPAGAVVLFDGSSVDGWEGGKLEEAKLLGVGCRTKQKFRDVQVHLEFRTPFMPEARGQARGNSGMYILDQYEFQVLDSFGLEGRDNETGGLYSISKPKLNMCLPPMTWQTYDVDFTAAKYDADKKTANARVTVKVNGVVVHDNLELPHNTPGGGLNDESQAGSLFLQDHGNPVRFRNIWVVEKK